MQTFSFVPPNMGLGDNKKSTSGWLHFASSPPILNCFRFLMQHLDYVFVDEHNRHKRLKGVGSLGLPVRLTFD